MLFAWDANGSADERVAQQIAIGRAPEQTRVQLRGIEMAEGAWEYRPHADAKAEQLAPQWPTRRQPAVDRNLLRLAMWELHHADTPPKVVVDEAIELAKAFSTEQSPAFVNAILDAVYQERLRLTGEAPPREPT